MISLLRRLLFCTAVVIGGGVALTGCDRAIEHNQQTPDTGKGGDGYGGAGTASNGGGYTNGDRSPLGGTDAHDPAGPNR